MPWKATPATRATTLTSRQTCHEVGQRPLMAMMVPRKDAASTIREVQRMAKLAAASAVSPRRMAVGFARLMVVPFLATDADAVQWKRRGLGGPSPRSPRCCHTEGFLVGRVRVPG